MRLNRIKFNRLFTHLVLPFLSLVACNQVSAETQEEPKLNMSGYLEAGILNHSLSSGYPDWKGQFVRGVLHSDEKNSWRAEIVNLSEFGDTGTLFAIGNTHDIDEKWFSSASVSTSSGGFFLPELRLDAALNRKWLEQLNLVTTVGVTRVNAKDTHQDHSVLLAASYYFEQPLVIEGGVLINHSDPGGVDSNSQFVAATYGQEKHRIISLRYGFGEEAYQVVAQGVTLVNFNSEVLTLTWREWLSANRGFQIRAEAYHNPSYDRNGIELSFFQDF